MYTHTLVFAAFSLIGMGLLDYGLMAGLPRLGLSFGPVVGSLGFILVARLLALLVIWVAWLCFRRLNSAVALRHNLKFPIAVLLVVNLFILILEVDAFYIEPFDLHTTTLQLEGPSLLPDRPLRILQISDLHIERITKRERALIDRTNALQPDLIVLTGDYPNFDYNNDPQTLQDIRKVLSQLHAPYGVYAIPGSPPVDTPRAMNAIFNGLKITFLRDEKRLLNLPGGNIYLIGVANLRPDRDSAVLDRLTQDVPSGAYSLLLYHTPDLINDATARRIDLYLAGHTHGGQVRLPFYGALVTMSSYGKQYEAGFYTNGSTKLYVSRGVGLEGLHLPRVRFLCPPEIVLIELGGR